MSPSVTEGLLIVDAQCTTCLRSIAWASKRWRRGLAPAVVASWDLADARLGELGLERHDVDSAVWLVEGDRRSRGAAAIARSLRRCRGAWPIVGVVLEWPLIESQAQRAYGAVARGRNRGVAPQCSTNSVTP